MVLWLTADTADRWGVSGRVWLFLQTAMSGFLFNASVVSHLFFKIALVSSLSEMIYLACKSGCLALYVVFSILFITAAVYFCP